MSPSPAAARVPQWAWGAMSDSGGPRRPPLSPLFRAASEPDLLTLPHLYLEYDEEPAMQAYPTEMLEDAVGYVDAVPLDSPAGDAPPSVPIPIAPRSTRSSPKASPRSSPRASPYGSPVLPARSPPQANVSSSVSFSEYVASELVRGRSGQESFGVGFVPAASSPYLQHGDSIAAQGKSPRISIGQPWAGGVRSSSGDPRGIARQDATSMPGGSPVFDMGSDASADDGAGGGSQGRLNDQSGTHQKGSAGMDAIDQHSADRGTGAESGDSRSTSEANAYESQKGGNGASYYGHGANRLGTLDCYQLDLEGKIEERRLSRTEILQEARDTLHESQPSAKAVGRWLSEAAQGVSPELQEFKSMLGQQKDLSNRKATQKALRKYLRNSLQPRDIRQVDPVFSAKPALWVRHSALVVSMEGLRAIILHNKMFLFDPDNEKTRQAVSIVQQSILTQSDVDSPQPFEFKALEGIFMHVVMGLEQEFEALKPKIREYLRQLPNQLTTGMLEELRSKKQLLDHFHSRASNVQDILAKLLDEDEDMAAAYLTEKHAMPSFSRNPLDHDEIETLVEAYLQVIEELVSQSVLLNSGIEDTEDLVSIHLDTLRNKLLSVELALSVVSMTFGFGGLVAGVFGMNLPIPPFEADSSRLWFVFVCLFILLVVMVVSWLFLRGLRRRGLWSLH